MSQTPIHEIEPPLTFDPHLHLQTIVLVGCGGTGSHLARLLARLLVHARALRLSVPTLHIIDPDVVEDANIGRQLYTPAELGRFKAEATARRLSCALGLPIQWSNIAFDPDIHIPSRHSTLLIDAVDNYVPRQQIAAQRGLTILACGNERTHGQVCLGNLSHIPNRDAYLKELRQTQRSRGPESGVSSIPTAYALFPSLLMPEPPSLVPETAAACAERVLLGEQDLYINEAIALIAARYVQQILFRQPIQSLMTLCAMEEMFTIKPIPLTLSNLSAYLPHD
jgi:PRTRC genetic system ThiF family protein